MADFDKKKTAQRIKALRTELDMSQKELAKMVGIAQNTLAQYENGIASPSLKVLVKLAEVLNTSTDYLLGA